MADINTDYDNYYLIYLPALANESTIKIKNTPKNEYKIISSVT